MLYNYREFSIKIKNFNSLVIKASDELLKSPPVQIFYKDAGDLSVNETENLKSLSSEIEGGANIYALWSRCSLSDNWVVMYVGQRSEKVILARLKEHLFKKSSSTNSKIENVKACLSKGYDIAITTIFVDPDPMRLSIEDQIIFINTNTEMDLPWNKKSRNVKLKPHNKL